MKSFSESKKWSATGLAEELESLLGSPPFHSGIRLCPESQLAERLGIGVSITRRSYNHLVNSGTLIRRRGSGTFVRRIPSRVSPPQALSADILMPDAEEDYLPAQPSTPISESEPGPLAYQRQLNICLWMWREITPFNQNLHQALVNELNQRGHNCSLVSSHLPNGTMADEHTLEQAIKDKRYDGYIVAAGDSALGNQFFQNVPAPVVFFSNPDPDLYLPRIYPHVLAALHEGVRHLSLAGCKNISFIRPQRPKDSSFEAHTFFQTLKQLSIENGHECIARKTHWETVSDVSRFLETHTVDGLYVTDDRLLAGVYEALTKHSMRPGIDIAVIAQSNKNIPLAPNDIRWSRMEFDPTSIGRCVAQRLLQLLEHAGTPNSSIAIHPTWIPGDTHSFPQQTR